MLSPERERLYDDIAQKIGRTPLVRYAGSMPNGNTIWIKRECDNPFGSHYDRVYIDLFRHYESIGKIKPGDKVLETTSGSAGVSFAGIGKLLGYDCYIAIPAGGEKARIEAIKKHLVNDDHLIFTPADDYISGFPKFLKKFLSENKDYFFLNHSMGSYDKKNSAYANNEVTLDSLENISREVLEQIKVDYFTLTGREDTKDLPHWDMELKNREDFGRTTRAAIAVALKIAGDVKGKNLLVLAYDKSDRYDNGFKHTQSK